MANGLLDALGQGLRGAGAVLSPTVYAGQEQEQQSALRAALARNNAMAGVIIKGIQAGSINPAAGQAALARMGFGGMGGLVQPSGAAQATARIRAALQGMPPGTFKGPESVMSQVNPADLLTSPVGQSLIKWSSTLAQQKAAREEKMIQLNLEAQGLEERAQDNQLNREQRAAAAQQANQIRMEIAQLIHGVGAGASGKGWQLGTSGGKVVRVNANLGTAQEQQPGGGWKDIPVPSDFMVTSASTAGLNNPQLTDNAAKLIANYDMGPLTGWALSRPSGQALMARVQALNPNYDASLWFRKVGAETDMGRGKMGQMTRSFNVFIQHTDVMRQAAQALQNGNVQLFNRIAQRAAQEFGVPAPTNFDAVKKIYGDELVKAIVGTGGQVSDRQAAADAVARANSPQQLLGVMAQYDHLMAGQVMGTRQQYEAATGRKDFDTFLLPKTLSVLEQYGYGAEPTTSKGTESPSGPPSKVLKFDAQGNLVK